MTAIVFFFQAEDGIRDKLVTGVQTCALPIFRTNKLANPQRMRIIFVGISADRDLIAGLQRIFVPPGPGQFVGSRSEEHTSELQSLAYLVCRLLLEKKKNILTRWIHYHVAQIC